MPTHVYWLNTMTMDMKVKLNPRQRDWPTIQKQAYAATSVLQKYRKWVI